MCGICGAAGPSASSIPVKSMCSMLRHRGPDEEGYFDDSYIRLGHTRLSIIDLKSGRQPICNEDESVCVIFNGEIYNFVELRKLLANKHEFRTRSDTEVIVHAYEEWGIEFVHYLRGMYAIALYDSDKGLLVLARDRLGKKPLYYTVLNDGTIVFASELKAFLPLYNGRFPRELVDREALAYYLYYGYIPAPLTIIENIYSLLPSQLLVYDIKRAEIREVTTYWDIVPGMGKYVDPSEATRQTYKILLEATRIRLRSDVPLSILLSGGLDSTTIAALAAKTWYKEYEKGLVKYKLRAVTIAFPGTPYDESEDARLAAEYIGIDLEIVDLDIDKVVDKLEEIVLVYDQPFADTSMIPTYFAFNAARRYSKVALTGDGGDEVFLGYPWMITPCNTITKTALPTLQIRLATLLATKRRLLSIASRMFGGILRYLNTYLLHDTSTVKKLLSTAQDPFKPFINMVKAYKGSNKCLDLLNYLTIRYYLPNDILVKVDRSSMGVSLEARSPMLDQNLVKYVTSLPLDIRYNGEQKHLLRKIILAEKLLPKELLQRPKRGFGAPIEYWSKHLDVHEYIEYLDIIELSELKRHIEKVKTRTNKQYYARIMFSLLTLGIWAKHYLG